MTREDDGAEASDKRNMGRPLFVSVGIALFIIGFLITVVFSTAGSIDGASTSSMDVTDSDDGSVLSFENSMAFLGVFIGLLGVVTATVGPLATVMVKSGRR